MTGAEYWALSPVIAMAAIALLAFSADAVLAERWAKGRRWGHKSWLAPIVAVSLIIPLLSTLNLWFSWVGYAADDPILFGSFIADRFTLFFQLLIIGSTAAVVIASTRYIQQFKDARGEFLGLLLCSATGMTLLVGATEMITIYVALETTALPVVALAALRRDGFSVEAGAKFLILSALSTALLLFGFVFLYGYTGATQLSEIVARISELPSDSSAPMGSLVVMFSLLLIVAGFGFKLAIAPWQMWVPDVYQGAPAPVAAFLSVASKASAFAVLVRILYAFVDSSSATDDWQLLFAVIAAITMTVGNLMALSQRNVKRILAYSTIAQAGYIMVGVAAISSPSLSAADAAAAQSIMYYLAGYAFSNLAVFLGYAAIIHRLQTSDISGINGLIRRAPLISILLILGLLSLLGMPPTVGFIAKAMIFGAALESGLIWLVAVALINTVIAAYYYLRLIGAIIFGDSPSNDKISLSFNEVGVVAVGAIGAVALGAAPWLALQIIDRAISIL